MLVVISLENIESRVFIKKIRAKSKIQKERPEKKNDWSHFQRRVEAPIVHSDKHTCLGFSQILTVSSFKRVYRFSFKFRSESGRTFLKPDFPIFLAGIESTFVDISGPRLKL